MRCVLALAATVTLLAATPALADPPPVSVDGQVRLSRQWTLADLQQLPPVRVRVSYATNHGDVEAVYTGALLWSIIKQAAPIDGPGKGAFLRRVVLVTGDDGYAVAVASGEIDPNYAGKKAIIAYAMDGKPIAQGLKLVVPDDSYDGRAVPGVASLTVVNLGPQPEPEPLGPSTATPPVTHFPP
jgi:DMSO/TMAO reductase YedYZ molybdopterin-dependent catalytic subunit